MSVIEWILGSSLIATLIGLATLKAAVVKANAEAKEAKAQAARAEAEAEGIKITNADNATRILVNNIEKPLREELHDTREKLSETEQVIVSMQKELSSTKRLLSRLTSAIELISGCPHADGCPVSAWLYSIKTDGNAGYIDDIVRALRQPDNRNKGDP